MSRISSSEPSLRTSFDTPPISPPTVPWVSGFLRRNSPTKKQSCPETPEERSTETSTLISSTNSTTSSSTHSNGGTYHTIHDPEAPEVPSNIAPTTFLSEFTTLIKMSIPVILAYTLQNSLQTVSVLIVGQISPEYLATAAFSYMFAMSTAWLIALGGTTALDTLCSSSFTGSKNPQELGILLQRAFVVLGVMYIPVCVVWWFSEPIFLALGQEVELARDSAKFLRWLVPGGLGYVYFEAGKKYLQAQGIMSAGTYVLLATAPLNAVLNWMFVYWMRWGLIGAPVATGITYWIGFVGIMAYARFVEGWERWGGWDRRCLKNVGGFARLAILGVVMVGTEWWAFEIVALAAGRLGTTSLASQSVIMTTDQVLNTIPFGIGIAASTRVGNHLGTRNAAAASTAASAAATLSIVSGALVMIAMLSVKDIYGSLFSSNTDVIKLVADVMPLVAVFQIADGLNGSCGGALRGMGRQHTGALVNLVCYYLCALPLGIWLAFWGGWGLKGLWVGQCVALYFVGIAEWGLVWSARWEVQVRKAFERMGVEGR